MNLTKEWVVRTVEYLRHLFPVSNETILALLSASPIMELRGGILAAKLLKYPMVPAVIICVLANLAPIPFVLLLARPFFRWMRRWKPLRRPVGWLRERIRKSHRHIQRYEMLGLIVLVALPLPGAGAWTGALVAAGMNLPLRRAFFAIVLGTVLAALIMTLLAYELPVLIAYLT